MNLNEHHIVWKDKQNHVRALNHNDEPVKLKPGTALQVAQQYMAEVADTYELKKGELNDLGLMAEKTPVNETSSFRQEIHKKDMDTSTVTYRQTYFGLPVWDAAVNIIMHEEEGKVLSSSTTAFHDIQVKDLTDAQIAKASIPLKPEELRKLLGVTDKAEIKTNFEKLVVYKYDAAKRVVAPHDDHNPSGFVDFHPSLPLPATAAKIKDGSFYVVRNVKFSMPIAGFGPMNWIALIEIESGSVLMMRALVDGVSVTFSLPTRLQNRLSGRCAQRNCRRAGPVARPGDTARPCGTSRRHSGT